MSYNKIIAVLAAIILVLNLVFFAMKRLDAYTFWAIMAVIGLYAYRDRLSKWFS